MSQATTSLRDRLKNAATEAMLAAAERVMIDKGYEKATMQDIAAAAGCAVGTLYLHFKNKEEIFRAVVGRHATTMSQAVAAAKADAKDPRDKIRRHIEAVLEWAGQRYEFVNLFCSTMPMRYDALHARLMEMLPEAHAQLYEGLLENIREAQEAGLLRKDFSAEVLRDLIDGMALTLIDQFSARPTRPALQEQVRIAWGFISTGIAPVGRQA